MTKSILLNNQYLIFKQKLLEWHFKENQRMMPWKGIKDVYKIWLSEIILQQTRVEQGLSYYEKFVKTYPTVEDLANASEMDVMKLWEGLGYYSRCKNLHATAKFIVNERKSKFPDTYEELLGLKGVGPYTASAIASFAYKIPKPVIDGNVVRVLTRYFGIKTAADSAKTKKEIEILAHRCIDTEKPDSYNQAIMDFGATVCKPANPSCNICCIKKECYARKKNLTDVLPVFNKKVTKKNRWFLFVILKNSNKKIAVLQRPSGDIWSGLFNFPHVEFQTKKEWINGVENLAQSSITGLNQLPKVISTSKSNNADQIYIQQLTHQKIHAKTIIIHYGNQYKAAPSIQWVDIYQLQQLPFPKLIRDIISKEFSLSK